MKKTVSILLLAAFLQPLIGQDKKHDLSLSYGIVTTDQVVDIFETILTAAFSFGNYTKTNLEYTGAKFITYKYGVNKRLKAGATFGIDGVKGDLLNANTEEIFGTFSTNHYTIAAEADLRYINTNWFEMYSGLGLGYTFTRQYGEDNTGVSDITNSRHVAFQLNLAGFRFGKNFGAYMETGFGYKGILNFGLSYRFK